MGIHDIPELTKLSENSEREEDSGYADQGWLGCTADDILSTKTRLYDVLIEMPTLRTDGATDKVWPRIQTADGIAIKATQRDLRRYHALRKGLRRMQSSKDQEPSYTDEEGDASEDLNEDSEPLLASSTILEGDEDEQSLDGDVNFIERSSWASIAYSSFFWWASSGERDALLADEASHDSALLEQLELATMRKRSSSRASSKGKRASTGSGVSSSSFADDPQGMAMVLIAYFHRWTSRIMETLSDVVAGADDETEEGVAEQGIAIGTEDVIRLGLDVWSQADKEFVKELVQLYFERDAEVKGINVECCGIKIC